MFHLISIWLTRIVVAGVAIALAVMYVIPGFFGEQPAQVSAPLQAERPIAPAVAATPRSEPAPAQPSNEATPAAADSAEAKSELKGGDAKTDAQATADAQPAAEAAATVRPCQPIARTASGALVYSMDCRRLPAE